MISEKPQIKVLILTVKWGHFSIASAIKDILKDKKYDLTLQTIEVEKFSDLSYTAIYHLVPGFWKIPYKLSEIEYAQKITIKYLERAYFATIEKLVKKYNPDIVINTYFAFCTTTTKLSSRYNFKVINIVTNPRTFSKIETTPGALNFLFDKKAQNDCTKMGVKKENTKVSGWFIRKEFQMEYNLKDVRKILKLDTNKLTICAVGGSEGTYNMLKILPALTNSKTPLQIVFICGNSKQLLRTVKMFSKIVNTRKNSNINIIPLGFTKDINKYIKAADLVIGKAGPNLLFETVATRTPFFAISHIAGQEDGNIDIIKQYRLGIVEENQIKVVKALKKIIDKPNDLHNFDKPLDSMAEYNKKAAFILRDTISTLMDRT